MSQSDELAIRLNRAAFNTALGEGNLTAIGSLLAIHAMLITGTDSAIVAGRKAQLQAWKAEFAAADRTIYTRLPTTIEASVIEPIALEIGTWQGIQASNQAPLAQGSYSAKWRKINDTWVIEAEIFVTLG
jgi:hypothetical protein